MADVDKWIEVAKQCKYLPENDLKVRCGSDECVDVNVKLEQIHFCIKAHIVLKRSLKINCPIFDHFLNFALLKLRRSEMLSAFTWLALQNAKIKYFTYLINVYAIFVRSQFYIDM